MTTKIEWTRRALMLGLAVATLAGCGALKPDPALVQRTEEAYGLLAAGRDEELFNKFAPNLRNVSLVDTIQQMKAAVPPGAAGPAIITGSEKTAGTDGGKASVILTYSYPDVPAFVTVEGHYAGSDKKGWEMDGFHVQGKRGKYEGAKLGDGTITPPVKAQ